jgi:hypothetical protein
MHYRFLQMEKEMQSWKEENKSCVMLKEPIGLG